MQKIAFAQLLAKYNDSETSPATEDLDKVRSRFNRPDVYHYFIEAEGEIVGAMRIVDDRTEMNKRLSQILVLPEYRKKGYATAAIREAEKIHGDKGWELETILQERSLCRFYESLGYEHTYEVNRVKEDMFLIVYEK